MALSTSSPDCEIFIGRQPIYDKDLNLYAHELLFRNSGQNAADFSNGSTATAQVILNTFLEIGLEQISGNKPVFLNFNRALLNEPIVDLLPPEMCVLEILEDVLVDDTLTEALDKLRVSGYRIALDDFVYKESMEPVLQRADIVKLDIQLLGPDRLKEHVERLRKHPITLLAEKIETHEEFEACKQLGFEYFQGYFLSRPDLLKGKRAPADWAGVLKLMELCRDPLSDVRKIADMISRNVSLSYKLLQAANSALFNRKTPVQSVSEAVCFMGTGFVYRLVSLLFLSGLNDKPSACLLIALQRACMCEILGESVPELDRDRLYTIGLLSAIDGLLDQKLEELVPPLPICEEMKDAILSFKGPMGDVLHAVISYQQIDWKNLSKCSFNPRVVSAAYWRSVPETEKFKAAFETAPKAPPSKPKAGALH